MPADGKRGNIPHRCTSCLLRSGVQPTYADRYAYPGGLVPVVQSAGAGYLARKPSTARSRRQIQAAMQRNIVVRRGGRDAANHFNCISWPFTRGGALHAMCDAYRARGKSADSRALSFA